MMLDVAAWNARLRGIAENDLDLVTELESFPRPVERATALLARCVTRLGGEENPGRSAVLSLSAGERQAFLLEIRRMTFGDRIECVQKCPACGERMDFETGAGELIAEQANVSDRRAEESGVRFRAPNGADLEAVAELPRDEAVRTLLLRCIESETDPEEWAPEFVARITGRMAEMDPLAEIRLDVTCPACGYAFATWFDVADYFAAELEAWVKRLYREVHQLALAYHWREEDILRMKQRRRRIYLDLLAAESANE